MPLKQRQGPRNPTVTIHYPTGSSSQSTSYEESDAYETYDEELVDSEEQWGDDEDDVLPSDSASTSNEGVYYPRGGPRRSHQRVVPVNHWREQQSPAPAHAPHPPPNVDHDADYRGHYGRGYAQPQQTHQAYYGGSRHAQGGYPAANHAPYNMGGYGASNGMVPFNQQYGNHPFAPHGPNGANFFGGEGRGYDMMPYGGYYGDPRQYSMPAHMQQYQMTHVPPPTEHPGQSTTPAPKEPDPEKVRLEAELAAIKAAEQKAKEEQDRKNLEAQIRKNTEEEIQRRMESMRLAQEQAQKEIARAKEEAERAARERIEAERKADEERAKQHAEAMARAEQNARMKFEADQKAAEAKAKFEADERARAEEAARIRLEAAIKAEAAAKAAAEAKAAEEAARIKQIEEDAKRKAEADAAAKVEKEKADAKAAAAAEEAAKKEHEALKKKIQEEAKQKLEDAAKKAEKPPIKFKDAVGRKFSFPFHLCQTWAGMEELIKQAFLQVDVLGPHVQEGHYDLIGPNGEIILPSVWERVVQPDWSITMTMWPIEKSPPVGPRPAGRGAPIPPPPPHGRGGAPTAGRRRGAAGPSMAPGWSSRRHGSAMPPGGIDVVNAAPSKPKKKKETGNGTVFRFFAASKPKKRSKK